jgi:5-methyltetrahydropteroyltriglutamate--homocysteine methyltransferase
MALSEALNKELNDLADAGCPVIQLEEPQIHMVPVRGKAFGKLDTQDLVGVFNNTVKGLRAKTEVWCHTCWGNPSHSSACSRRSKAISRPSRCSTRSTPMC